jgi:hypothetical protein
MPRWILSLLAGLSVIFTASGPATAQSAKDIVGVWTLVSNETVRPDGSRVKTFGSSPVGLLIFDNTGRYSLQICRSDRTKFKSNNRLEGTTDEYKEAIHACNPHWGRYTASENDKVITFKIEHSTFPNWEGLEQKRAFTISGDQLKYTVPTASGGGTAEVVWQRAK